MLDRVRHFLKKLDEPQPKVNSFCPLCGYLADATDEEIHTDARGRTWHQDYWENRIPERKPTRRRVPPRHL